MQVYQEFMKNIDLVKPGSSDRVSEADLGNPRDLCAVLTGFGSEGNAPAITVHFGQGDFTGKYRTLVENFTQWQANARPGHAVDLRDFRPVGGEPHTPPPLGRAKQTGGRRL